MTEILPNLLYLGNARDAQNPIFLESKNIQYILNCAEEVNIDPKHRKYLKLHFDDFNKNKKFYTEIDGAMQFINEAILYRKPILIHCYAGINRSSTTTIWYLRHFCGLDWEKAHLYVRFKRWYINPILLKMVLG